MIKTAIRVLIVFGVSFSGLGVADDIMWVKLDPRFIYRDGTTACSHRTDLMIGPVYFRAWVNTSTLAVTRASIFGSPSSVSTRSIAFTPTEARRIKLGRDRIGDYWVKNLPLSARVLNWLFFNLTSNGYSLLTGTSMGCRPPSGLRSMKPWGADFVFSITTDIQIFNTPLLGFRGTKVSGGEYEVKLGFNQEMMMGLQGELLSGEGAP